MCGLSDVVNFSEGVLAQIRFKHLVIKAKTETFAHVCGCMCMYTDSRESFSSSSFRLGSLCRPKAILRASTCSFRGLYSSCRRRVVSSSLFRSFSDCLMVLSIWVGKKWVFSSRNYIMSRLWLYFVLVLLFFPLTLFIPICKLRFQSHSLRRDILQ